MHISKLQLVNFRNFGRANVVFRKGINTIIGENGSGKTNLFRAIRLLLDDNMLRFAYKLDASEFHRGLGDWRGHWIIISLEFDEVSQDESIQSLFLHKTGNIECGAVGRATYNLIFRPKLSVRMRMSELEEGDVAGLAAIRQSITIDDYETWFTGRSSADFTDPDIYRTLVGDFETATFSKELEDPSIGAKIQGGFSITEEVSFTFVQALRDVVSEFQNNRTNPLLTLLKSKSGEIDPTMFQPIATLVGDLNAAIGGLPDVQGIRNDIADTINDAAGKTYSPTSLSIKSDLSDEADRLFQSLKLFVGEAEEGHEGAIHELSLGGANLIYLTLKLLEFKYQKTKQSFANFLLIEEPEAHIHTHIQKTLFDKLNFPDTQIIYSTHSTQISEVSNVENMNILARSSVRCDVFQPADSLDPTQIGNIRRYLDAVRSNLLFAKSVLLVEGDAEEILIPIIVKKVFGISLDKLGVSLVNIRSTGFENIAILFAENRIRKRCSILTDLDAAFIDTTADANDTPAVAKAKAKAVKSQAIGAARKVSLEALCRGNPWLECFSASHTFEVDLLTAGNKKVAVDVISSVYKDASTIDLSTAELGSADIAVYGQRVLTMANHVGKGWFAILMGKIIDHQAIIPAYIVKAVLFAHGPISKAIWFNIFQYRLNMLELGGAAIPPLMAQMKDAALSYQRGDIDFEKLRTAFTTAFPGDALNYVLSGR